MVYVSYIRSVVDYCGSCYLPAVAKPTIQQLEVTQCKAPRVITGCVASFLVSALERESNLMPLSLSGKYLAGCAFLRAAFMSANEPLPRLRTERSQVEPRLKDDYSPAGVLCSTLGACCVRYHVDTTSPCSGSRLTAVSRAMTADFEASRASQLSQKKMTIADDAAPGTIHKTSRKNQPDWHKRDLRQSIYGALLLYYPSCFSRPSDEVPFVRCKRSRF